MKNSLASDLEKLLSASQIKKLNIYARKLAYFNKSTAFYSRRKPENFCWELILDCLLAGRILLKDCTFSCISDIGSGAGLPGLVLSVLDPVREIQLFEPHKKKAGFLEYIIREMNLRNVQVKNIPIQEEKTLLKCGVSKAFLPLGQRLVLSKNCFEKGAVYYHLQSPALQKMDEKIKNFWRIKELKRYSHPFLPGERALLKSLRV